MLEKQKAAFLNTEIEIEQKGESYRFSKTQNMEIKTTTKSNRLVRQFSWRLVLRSEDIASPIMHDIFRNRVRNAEGLMSSGQHLVDMALPRSRRSHTYWEILRTRDDSSIYKKSDCTTFMDLMDPKNEGSYRNFFASRVADPTSFFFKYHFDNDLMRDPKRVSVDLADIHWLKPHEDIESRETVVQLSRDILRTRVYTKPLLVDKQTGVILDGHHRYSAGLELKLDLLPVVYIDYLLDDEIVVDVWPGCGRDTMSKDEVVERGLSKRILPAKTTRHKYALDLPPISVSIDLLHSKSSNSRWKKISCSPQISKHKVEKKPPQHDISIKFVADRSLDDCAIPALRALFRNRLRNISDWTGSTIDMVQRPKVNTWEHFNAIRFNDPTSSFCIQRDMTLDDLISHDRELGKRFFVTRVTDPTSYFYRYRFDSVHPRRPKKLKINLVRVSWLKQHEHVVSWDRVESLRKATVQWNAYLEPLLVDRSTGAILDGHHRFNVGKLLALERVPAVVVDYLSDESIEVDVWPDCGRDSLTKEEVIAMSLSKDLFPPKTSRHTFSDDLPPISISLDILRQTGDKGNIIPYKSNSQ